MDEKLSYWAAVIFSAISLVLVIVNVSLSNANTTLQQEVQDRQNAINSGIQLNQFNQSLIQALAQAAFKGRDLQVRDLLASQGISLREAPPAETPASAPAPKDTKKK